MNILITGNRKEIYFLIKSFLKKGHELTYISDDPEVCRKIAKAHNECNVVCGDPTNPNILEESEVYLVDTVIAFGESDPDNLIVCQMMKKLFSTEKTVAIVNDPKNMEIFKTLGVDEVVSTANTIFSMIEKKISLEKINSIINMEAERASIIEFFIDEKNEVIGEKIMELSLPKNSLIGCIIRDNKAIIPRGDTKIYSKDKLIVITLDDEKNKVIEILKGESDEK